MRQQIPLAPAFACTAHAAQGQTLDCVIADLQQGRGVKTVASSVAITCVRARKSLLIYRPFDREPYCSGPLLGAEMLLKHLRGEDINWEQIEEDMVPKKNMCWMPHREAEN